MSRALIFVNGELIDPGAARAMVQSDDLIIAADGGARHALALGIIPAVIIGDLDSLSPSEVRDFTDMDVHILRFPQSKDETDMELALGHALRAGHSPIIVIAALGGRLDQMLGNLAMLSSPEALRADVRLDDGLTEAFFVSRKADIHGKPGDTVSFLACGVPAEGVSTEGLVYPLHEETLVPYRTRSISNQMLAEIASVSLKSGLLLCIHIRKK
jgi:thiamine pyrophosphokinase